MTMNIIKLITWMDASEAQTIIHFIDQLRDALTEHYGECIAQQHRAMQQQTIRQIDFIDDPPFNGDPF